MISSLSSDGEAITESSLRGAPVQTLGLALTDNVEPLKKSSSPRASDASSSKKTVTTQHIDVSSEIAKLLRELVPQNDKDTINHSTTFTTLTNDTVVSVSPTILGVLSKPLPTVSNSLDHQNPAWTVAQTTEVVASPEVKLNTKDVKPQYSLKEDITVSPKIKAEVNQNQSIDNNNSRKLIAVKLRFLVALHTVFNDVTWTEASMGADSMIAPFKLLCFDSNTNFGSMIDHICKKFKLNLGEGELELLSIHMENPGDAATIVVDDDDSWEYALELATKSMTWSKEPVKLRVLKMFPIDANERVNSQDIDDLILSIKATTESKHKLEKVVRDPNMSPGSSMNITKQLKALNNSSSVNETATTINSPSSFKSPQEDATSTPASSITALNGETKQAKLNLEVLAKKKKEEEAIAGFKKSTGAVMLPAVKVESSVGLISGGRLAIDRYRPSWGRKSEDDRSKRLSNFEYDNMNEEGQIKEDRSSSRSQHEYRKPSDYDRKHNGSMDYRTSNGHIEPAGFKAGQRHASYSRHGNYHYRHDDRSRSRSPNRSPGNRDDRDHRLPNNGRDLFEDKLRERRSHEVALISYKRPRSDDFEQAPPTKRSYLNDGRPTIDSTSQINTRANGRNIDTFPSNGFRMLGQDVRVSEPDLADIIYRGQITKGMSIPDLMNATRLVNTPASKWVARDVHYGRPQNSPHYHHQKIGYQQNGSQQYHQNGLPEPNFQKNGFNTPINHMPLSNNQNSFAHKQKEKKSPRSILSLETRYSGIDNWEKYDVGTATNGELKARLKDVNDFGAEWSEVFSPDFPLDPDTRNGQSKDGNRFRRGGVIQFFFRSRPVKQGVPGFGSDPRGECAVIFNLFAIQPESLSFTIKDMPNPAPPGPGPYTATLQTVVIQFCVGENSGFVHRGEFKPKTETEWPAGVTEALVKQTDLPMGMRGRHITYNSAGNSQGPNADNLGKALSGLVEVATSGKKGKRRMWVRFSIAAANGGWEVVEFLKRCGAKRPVIKADGGNSHR